MNILEAAEGIISPSLSKQKTIGKWLSTDFVYSLNLCFVPIEVLAQQAKGWFGNCCVNFNNIEANSGHYSLYSPYIDWINLMLYFLWQGVQ